MECWQSNPALMEDKQCMGGPHGLPKVSVVTVVYNAAATLERTILSVLDQGYPNLEYIIVTEAARTGPWTSLSGTNRTWRDGPAARMRASATR